MLLIERSGSMLQPVSATDARCPLGCGPSSPCPSDCPTRLSELRAAVDGFLSASGNVMRVGLALFPSSSQCEPTNSIEEHLPAPAAADDAAADAANAATVTAVRDKLALFVPVSGGSPAGASLAYVGDYQGLSDSADNRQDYVLLLTDGPPNCNAQHPQNTCSGTLNPGCRCTTSVCTGSLCAQGCLDQDATVSTIRQLRTRGITVIVVGYGSEARVGDTLVALADMADAGGFGRSCPSNTSPRCGDYENRCLPGGCERSLYLALDGAELATTLADISRILTKE